MSVDGKIEVRVDSLERLPGGTVAIRLVSSNGRDLPAFTAGSHVDVRVSDEVTRQYSLCGAPDEIGCYRLGVLREAESRGGSEALCERLLEGDVLWLSPPKNQFPLNEDAPYSVLIGGGIGITPLLSMAYRLHALGREFEIRYCVAAREQAAFLDILEASPFSNAVNVHTSRTEPSNRFDPAKDLPSAGFGAHVYVCGPAGLMDTVLDGARAAGYPDSRLHKEDFGAEVDVTGEAFEVEARSSGVTVHVGKNERIVDALKAAGISIDISCEEGVCGTCLCDVIEGEPDHRDAFLTEEERAANEMIMVCCSRSKTSRLVLDV